MLVKKVKKPHANQKNNVTKTNKDSVATVGHSRVQHVNGRDISHSRTVEVCPSTEASIYDLMVYAKPAMRKKPRALVIQIANNDIQQEINFMKMVKKLAEVIQEIDSENENEITFPGLIQEEDHDLWSDIEEIERNQR